jgi:hypothetical protein
MDDDLLLRMSKKIAQLTKVMPPKLSAINEQLFTPQRLTTVLHQLLLQVIYHLNNINEDCEFDIQEQAEQYEREIEQVLKESAAKLDAITEQLRQQEANQRQEAAALQVSDAKQKRTPVGKIQLLAALLHCREADGHPLLHCRH